MSSNTVYLITGANRGLGLGLVDALLKRSHTTVIAGVRDVDASAKKLQALPVGQGSKIIIAKFDSMDQKSPAKALEGIEGLDKIDVVISNA
jgi:norsolorinic acid ketoreductase